MLIPFSKMINIRSHWVKKCSTVSEFLAVLLREESKRKVLNDLTEALSTLSGNKLRSKIRAAVNALRADHQSIPMVIAMATVLLHMSMTESFESHMELRQFCELYAWMEENELKTARARAKANGSYDQPRILDIITQNRSIWESRHRCRQTGGHGLAVPTQVEVHVRSGPGPHMLRNRSIRPDGNTNGRIPHCQQG